MKENRDFKGVWIPKEIWLNSDLSIIEKVLLVEIDSLDNSDRGCFASNEYLAKFVQLSEGRVANIISDLKKRKFLIQVFFDGRNRGLRISKSESSFNENVNIIIQRIKQVIIQLIKVVKMIFHSPLPMLTLLTLSFGKVSMML